MDPLFYFVNVKLIAVPATGFVNLVEDLVSGVDKAILVWKEIYLIRRVLWNAILRFMKEQKLYLASSRRSVSWDAARKTERSAKERGTCLEQSNYGLKISDV